MSDDELDREWKPSARPQSTMAKSFSLALNDLFKIDNSLADLDAAVSEKKKAVSSQTSELEALEARLKATEERLKARQGGVIPPVPKGRSSSGRSSPHQRMPLGDTFTSSPTKAEHPSSPLSSEFGSRATTNGRQTGKGEDTLRKQEVNSYQAMPPTPGTSEGEYGSESEYVLVEAEKNSTDAGVQDGDMPPPPRKNA
ncbi:hypothetical protein G7Y89_g14274 [Cudoniella acicularis]|uniref:Uncharacterized protein n=1 Tax=Cudoniella acicularis TaxID=354080 RepID=A0A8H4VUJ2_9HELO|nr:hypothetical protein G7Y89_g14274 [Cudoniella acicularis]